MSKLKLKNSKSALKRFKFSSKGKLQRRHVRMSHYNALDTGSFGRKKKVPMPLAKSNKKDIKNLMPYL